MKRISCLRSPVAYAPELQRRGTAIAYGDGTQTGLRALSHETYFYVHLPLKRISCLRQTGLRAPPHETYFMPSADRFTCTSL
jgi:hypothetical protein